MLARWCGPGTILPMTPASRPHLLRTVRLGLGAVAIVVLAACSGSVSTGGSIDEAELEQQVSEQLAAQNGDGLVPTIDCPGDLDAEVGARVTCDLTVEGDDTVYPANVEVTKVDGGVASFSVEVGQP